MRIWDLKGKHVAIWGLGREGRATLKLLRKELPTLKLTVLNDSNLTNETVSEFATDPAVAVLVGEKALSALPAFDVVIKSPGISMYRPEVRDLKQKGVFITSATRLWFAEHCEDTTVCITGTKGKSTTASLVAHFLKHCGLRVVLAGNIGVPLFDMFKPDPPPDAWVIEISSYQASDFDGTPTVAALINLFPEHLDWHGNVENYFSDKLRLFDHCRTSVLNRDDSNTVALQCRWNNPIYFNDPEGFHIKDGHICEGGTRLLPVEHVKLKGSHNLSNICAALTVVRCLTADIEDAVAAIPSFTNLPHRLSVLGEKDGVMYVNDSISTAPQSAMAAVESFPGQRISILVGGFDRGLNWQELAQFLVQKPVYCAITMPDTGVKIASAMREILTSHSGTSPLLYEAESLVDAVAIARRVTLQGGIILLSPAAPSYGRFKNFEERGRAFAQAAGFEIVGL